MNKVKIITSIYSDLYGTELGGRPSRKEHYKLSLISLLKMSDADFICYTSDREINELEHFFYDLRGISKDKLKFEVFDLKNYKYSEFINQYKDVETIKKGDRCIEIQYAKFYWITKEDMSYDYYYWFDAGLSHCGLIPLEYLPLNGTTYDGYYESNLFNNKFLKNLLTFSEESFVIIGKENERNYWERTVDPKHYDVYDRSRHIIGGFFGGKKELWLKMLELFEYYMNKVTFEESRLYYEEHLMSLIYQNHKDFFKLLEFDIWWPDIKNAPVGIPEDTFEKNKSFYKILEELNE